MSLLIFNIYSVHLFREVLEGTVVNGTLINNLYPHSTVLIAESPLGMQLLIDRVASVW